MKDRLDKKEFRLDYCPTGNMIADFFTKPLQGALFHKFRAVIMGWEHIDTLSLSGHKEHVENSVSPDEEMRATSAVKKSYADAVKNNRCKEVHIDNTKQHLLPINSDTTSQLANSK